MQDKLVNRMAEFIQLERDLRAAPTEKALGFVLTNYLRKLLFYDVALLALDSTAKSMGKPVEKRSSHKFKVATVSGVSEFDQDAPIVQFCEQLANQRDIQLQDTQMHTQGTLPSSLHDTFEQLDFSELVTVKMDTGNAVVILFRNTEWQISELQLLQQVSDVASHALQALQISNLSSGHSRIKQSIKALLKPDWRWVACGIVAAAFLPIKQSVIASGEVAPASPTVVAAGLDAVVKDIHVFPNQHVFKNQVLVNFDASTLTHQRSSVVTELDLAKERLRKARQQSLNSTLDDNAISELETQINLKKLELDFIDEQMSRLQIRASRDGIVLFTRKKDWEGRAVMTGEKIMEIAGTDDNQFEIWLAANDAIGLESGSAVTFFPDANPLRSVDGEVKQVSYFAASSKNNEHAYRVVATQHAPSSSNETDEQSTTLRLGMKGTFRLYGKQVRLGYHLLRKPLSAVRRTIGV